MALALPGLTREGFVLSEAMDRDTVRPRHSGSYCIWRELWYNSG